MRIFKVIYYLCIAFLGIIVILLIFSVFPIAGNYKVMVVLSGSMEPAIKMGGLVFVKPIDDYKIGEVITYGQYSRTKAPTTHRIYDIKIVDGEPRYITKGDANEEPDGREISKGEIVGKVLFDVPYVGFAIDFAKKPLGFMLLIVLPAAIIIYDEAKKIFGEIKKMRKKREANL